MPSECSSDTNQSMPSQEVMSRKYLLLFYIVNKVGTRLGHTLLDELSSC